MSEILIEMAQRAGQNEALCAGLIRKYGERRGMQWEEIARQLHMDSAGLAKLALCRSPRPNRLDHEVEQIAAYLGVEKTGLLEFFQANIQPVQAKPGILETLKAKLKTQSPKRYVFALAVVAVIVLVGALIAFNPRPSTATLVVSAGQVTVQTPSHPEQLITPGQAVNVKTGDSLALQPGAVAQLRLYDGSTVDLSENTRVEVQELATSDNQFRVRLKMLTGRTVSRVLRLLGVGDIFEISTPSSTVSVRGTVFTVQVLNAETTYVACEKGVVKVVSGSQLAEVKAGQQLTASPGQPLEVKPMEVKPLSTQEPVPPTNGGEGIPPTGETNPPKGAAATPAPKNSAAPSLPAVSPEETPVPATTETVLPNGGQSTPGAPAVTSGSSGPQGTPNKPSQVPGKPPSVVPGNGNPPSGGGEPPGKGGEPPGQTKDKNKPDKGKSGKH
jgi:hypothetical protein